MSYTEPKEEITRRSVLAETLKRHETLLKGYSKNGNGLEPAEGFAWDFDAEQQKCRILRELIRACESEPVRKALADWQQVIMEEDRAGKPHGLTL